MVQQLTEYTQTQNLQQGGPAVKLLGDSRVPYSYSEWFKRNVGIIPEQARAQYEKYLLDWYRDREDQNIAVAAKLKEDYIALARQISAVFGTTVDASWLIDVDFADELDVQNAIPLYAKKLKELAIYLVNKREAVKRAKLKYNLVGTGQALERVFYEYLLKAFTQRRFPGNEYITAAPALSTLSMLPELSAVAGTFQIRIDEIYDDTAYFDKDPRQAVTSYFSTSAAAVTEFFDTLDISEEALEFIYSTGITPLCADNPLFWSLDSVMSQYADGVPLSALQSLDSSVLLEYTKMAAAKKYLGTNQYWMSGGFYVPWESELHVDIQPGNNWMYWPSGSYLHQEANELYVDSIPLVDSTLVIDGAVGGRHYDESDVIFFRRGSTVEGAWLQSIYQETSSAIMSAEFVPGSYEFKYPFPGYGVSGADIDWTGPEFSNTDSMFKFLTKEEQRDTQAIYWKTPVVIDAEPIELNQTNLIESGAHADITYDTADAITYRRDPGIDLLDQSSSQHRAHAFCYKVDATDLPIETGKDSKIAWPLYVYEQQPDTIRQDQAAPINILQIDPRTEMPGAVAGTTIEDADVILKYADHCSNQLTGAAWLYGDPVPLTSIVAGVSAKVAYQPALSFAINGGDSAVFAWQDTDTAASDVFKAYKHQKGCQYHRGQEPNYYYDKDNTHWKNCSCRSVVYSPLGHVGQHFDEYTRMCDFIVAVTDPTIPFTIESWRGSDGLSYLNSTDFGWFRIGVNEANDKDVVNWRQGQWITNTNQPFVLRQNRLYRYVRCALNQCNDSPYFVIRRPFNTFNGGWQAVTDTPTLDALLLSLQ